jgi:hypothetical protein
MIAAVLAVLGLLPLTIMFGSVYTDNRSIEALGMGGALFVMIALSQVIGGRRGIAAVWVLLFVTWVVFLATGLTRGAASESATALATRFVVWSTFGLPLLMATIYLLPSVVRRGPARLGLLLLTVAWFALVVVSSGLASYAADVVPHPVPAGLRTLSIVILVPAPPGLALLFAMRSWTARNASSATS